MTLRPDRFCNHIYSWVAERHQDKAQLDIDLSLPLPGQAAAEPSPEQLEQEGAAFMSLLGQVGGAS